MSLGLKSTKDCGIDLLMTTSGGRIEFVKWVFRYGHPSFSSKVILTAEEYPEKGINRFYSDSSSLLSYLLLKEGGFKKWNQYLKKNLHILISGNTSYFMFNI